MTDHDRLHPLRPLLKNWVWEHGRIGTRYLDCVDGEIRFDEGKKSHFAAEKYIYVPLGKGAEDDASAEGPAIHEAGLARFCEPRSWVRRRTPVLQRMSSAQCRTAWRLACSAHINGRHERRLPDTRRNPCSMTRSARRLSTTSGVFTPACGSNWRCTISVCSTACPRRCLSAIRPSSTGACVPVRHFRLYRSRWVLTACW